MERKHIVRTRMRIASVVLLAAECLFMMIVFSMGSNANQLLLVGSKLILPALVYTVVRWISPDKPRYGITLPGMIFFAALLVDLVIYRLALRHFDASDLGCPHCYRQYHFRQYLLPALMSAAASFFGLLPCRLHEKALAKDAEASEDAPAEGTAAALQKA